MFISRNFHANNIRELDFQWENLEKLKFLYFQSTKFEKYALKLIYVKQILSDLIQVAVAERSKASDQFQIIWWKIEVGSGVQKFFFLFL